MIARWLWSSALAAALLSLHWSARPAFDPMSAARCTSSPAALPLTGAKLLRGIGSYRAVRVSDSDEAQQFFEQGMVMGWGFNAAESQRSFRAAIELDPTCAMCHWGLAWSLGPGLNHDMEEGNRPLAQAALVKAHALAVDARSRALIEATALRYSGTGSDHGRGPAYVSAMQRLARSWPGDADIALLAAEATMVARPYDWWRDNGNPKSRTPEIAATLQRSLLLAPDHPGALHYTIHLYEDSPSPGRALDAARRLPVSAPGLGHLVHMPSHIDLRLGRYHDAVLANQSAIEVDRSYRAAAFGEQADSFYLQHYARHNLHFLWVAALWSGESATARDAAQRLSQSSAVEAEVDSLLEAAPWVTDIRFAAWDAVLARPMPPASDSFPAAMAHFARGLAFAARGDAKAGEAERVALQRTERTVRRAMQPRDEAQEAADMLRVAHWQLGAELAAAQGQRAAAIALARRAVAAEDRLPAGEPSRWQIPSRHGLGRLLLADGKAAAAASVYRADLVRHPDNAVALAGLARAERDRGELAAAERMAERARLAWQHADRPLSAL